MKALITYSSNVPLLELSGLLWRNALELLTFPITCSKVGNGARHGFHMDRKYYPWGIAAICWAIWKNRNKACFENKIIQNPLEVICHACALMNFWTGLFTNIDKEQLEEGVATMLRVAKQLLSVQQKEQPGRPDADG
jgi:hypothetical protein